MELTLSSSAAAATAAAAAAASTAEDAGGASATSGIVMTLIGGRTTPSECAPCARLALHAAPPDAVSADTTRHVGHHQRSSSEVIIRGHHQRSSPADTTIASRAPSRVAGPYPS